MAMTDDLRAHNFDDAADIIERAYGLLWREMHGTAITSDARKLLLTALDKEGQKRGIAHAVSKYGSVEDDEILALG